MSSANLILTSTAVTLAVGMTVTPLNLNAEENLWMNLFNVTGGEPVKDCPSGTSATTVIRVKLHERLDDLISKNPKPRVRFSSSSDNNNIKQYNDMNVSHPNIWTGPRQSNESAVPYNVDLTSIGLDISTFRWIEIRIMLQSETPDANDPQESGPASNLNFFMEDPVHGATIHLPGLKRTDICYSGANEDGHGSNVMTIFVRYPLRLVTAGQPPLQKIVMPINILLVPKNGATGTPIMIDPKILNQG